MIYKEVALYENIEDIIDSLDIRSDGSVKRFMKKLPSFCLLETIIFMLRKSLSSLKLTGFQPGLDRNLEAK